MYIYIYILTVMEEPSYDLDQRSMMIPLLSQHVATSQPGFSAVAPACPRPVQEQTVDPVRDELQQALAWSQPYLGGSWDLAAE